MTTRSGYRQCTKCGQARAVRFYVGKRGRVCSSCRKARTRSASRGKRLLDLYGLTLEDYAALFEAQGGKCATCGGVRRQNLSVDHDHNPASPYVRGLLCRRCNRTLAVVGDNIELLESLAWYLGHPPAYAVIGQRAVVNAHTREAA